LKFFLYLIFFSISLFSSNIELTLEEKNFLKSHNTITLGTGAGWEPSNIVNENGTITGVDADILELINKATGANFQLVVGDWTKIQEQVKNKKIDGLINIVKTPQREDFLNFSSPYTIVEYSLSTNYKNKNNFTNSDLKNLTIGIERNQITHQNITNKLNIKNIVYINNLADGYEKLSNGLIDIIPTVNGVNYLLSKKSLPAVHDTNLYHKQIPVFVGIIKEYPEAISIFEKGLKTISEETLKELRLKWNMNISDDTQIDKYHNLFTDEEIKYLKENSIIKVGHSSVFEPLFFKDSSGNLNGIIIDAYKTLSKNLGFEVEFIDKSWKEIINDLKSGNIDVIPAISKNIAKKENLLEAEPLSRASYSIFTKDLDSFKIDSIKDLYGKKVAYNQNILSLKNSLEKYKDKIEIRGQKTTLETFFLLENRKVDAVITFHRDKHILAKYGIKDIHSSHTIKEFSPNTTAAVGPNNKILQSIINKSINSLSLEEKNTILRKWLGDDSQKDKNNQLTKEEIDFLKTKNEFTVCSRYKHYPIDGVEDGKLIGISGQIYDEISKKLNIKFTPLASNSLKEFEENISKSSCDLISIVKNTYTGFKNFKFTKPILNQFYVSIGSINNPYISNLSQLDNHTFYVKDKIFKSQFLKRYPKAEVIVNSNIDEIMDIIKKDSKSHFILTTYTADEIIRRYGPDKFKIDDIFDNLKANGAILVNNKYPLLRSSIDKTISDFSKEELNNFASNYRISKYVIEKSYEWLWYVLFILLIIIALLQFRYIKILDKKREKEKQLTDSLKQARKMAKISSFVNDLSKDYYEEIDDSIYDIFEISQKDYPKISRDILFKFIHPDEKEEFRKKLFNSYNSNKEHNTELRIVTPTKKVKYMILYWKIIHDINNKPIKTIATIQDVTEKVLNEKERIQQAFLLQKQSKLALQGEMLNMIAHQWRQPLNQLSVLTQMFIRKVEPSVAQKDEFIFYKNTTNDIIKHLSQTIDDFCNFYKPDKKKEFFLLEEFYRNLKVLISNRVENLIIEYNNLQKLKIYTFKNELLQVLLTMLNNSLEALNKENPNFYIKIYNLLENEKLIIKIEDNAGGIPQNIIENIFEPYFSTKEEKNGSGLGLYMSKLIIEDSISGKINVKVQDDITVFTIEIPLENKDEK